MPVYATPSGNPGDCPQNQLPGTSQPPTIITPLSPTCFNQSILTAASPKDSGTGRPALTRTHAYNIKGAQKVCIDHVMRDVNGNPVDLSVCLGFAEAFDPGVNTPPDPLCPVEATVSSSSSLLPSSSNSNPSLQSSSSLPSSSQSSQSSSQSSEGFTCGDQYQIVFRLGEYLTCGGKEFTVTVIDPVTGHVRVCLDCDDTQCPGVYFGEFAVVEVTEPVETPEQCAYCPIFSNHVYVIIGRNLFQANMCNRAFTGPPSIAEVRMHLRDSSPSESYLLDNVAFADEEIAAAMILPVQYWNEIPPDLGYHNTNNFPYRYHWLMAIAGHLFQAAAEQQRRNNLRYSASGVAVDDQDKEPNYEQAAQRRLEEFRLFVKRKKAEINLNLGYGGLGSTYGGGGGGGNGFRGGQPYRTWYNY